jgi:hypothetical protein
MGERSAITMIFNDCRDKDRLLRAPALPLFGSYQTSFSHGAGNGGSGAVSNLAATPASESLGDRSPGDMAGGDELPGSKEGEVSAGVATHTVAAGGRYQLFSSLISHHRYPVRSVASSEGIAAAGAAAAGAELSLGGDNDNDNDGQDSQKPPGSDAPVDKQQPSACASAAVPAGGAVRASKPRGASSDKVELRKKWVACALKASAYLSATGPHRASIVEVQALLDAALQLPPYNPSMSFINSAVVSTVTAASLSSASVTTVTTETALLESASTMLGKLLKVRQVGLCSFKRFSWFL